MNTFKSISLFLITITCMVVIQSCNSAKKSMAEMPMLDGTWELSYISGPHESLQQLYPEKMPTVVFDTPSKRLSGTTGCNQYSGALIIDGSKIDLTTPIIVTKMYCMNSAAGETQFLQLLPKVNNYTVADGILSFRMGNVTLMRFNKKM